jgi:cytochrome c556
MNRIRYILAGVVLIPLLGLASVALAQDRLSDEQVKRLLVRIEKSADNFRSSLKHALDHSRFDDTKAEDEINRFVKDFEAATDRWRKRFDARDTASDAAQEVLNRAARIDGFILRHRLTERAQNDWATLRSDLDELARAYGISWSWTTGDAQPERASEKEMKALLQRLEQNADKFRGSLKNALEHSRFDGTKREDNINQFVKDFEAATDRLKGRFDDDRAAVGAASEVLRRAAPIDGFMRRHQLTSRAEDDWLALRRSLDELARAYNVSIDWESGTVTTIPR